MDEFNEDEPTTSGFASVYIKCEANKSLTNVGDFEPSDNSTSSSIEEKVLHNMESSQIEIGGKYFSDLNTEAGGRTQENLVDSEMDDEYLETNKLNRDQEKELTNKFLTGELSFSEYAARMVEVDGDDIEDDIVENLEAPVNIQGVHKEQEEDKRIIKTPSSSKKKGRKRPRNRYNLPPALKGLMGEANLRCARGDHDSAIKMCLEIIRQVPKAPEPFQTLAGIYEELGHHEKSLQMALIAAHLSPSDAYQWIHLAVTSEEQGNTKQAITCYSKAIAADVSMIDIHMKRAALFEQLGEKKLALRAYSRLLSVIDAKEEDTIMDLAKMLAEKYHQEKELHKAKESLEISFKKCPHLVTSEYVNIMLEILISLKDYKRCIETMVEFCGLKVEFETTGDGTFVVNNYFLEKPLAVDINAKLFIVLIHLKAFHMLESLLSNLLLINPEEAGDIYFDVAEGLMEEEKYKEALTLLHRLVSTKNFNLPAVWLRFAECHKMLGCYEESVKVYLSVVEKAPHHLGARLAVAELLNKLDRKDEAIAVLTQDEDSEILDPSLLYERCQLLLDNPDQIDQFLAVGQLLISRHCVQIRNRDEMYALTTQRSDRKRYILKETRSSRLVVPTDNARLDFSHNIKEPSIEDEWKLFWTMCEKCLEVDRPELLQRLAFSAQGSQRFTKYSQEIDLLCLISCYYNSDAYYGYNMARGIVVKKLNCPRAWNFFNLMLIRADDSRHNRFLMRLLTRNQSHTALANLHANNCLVAGTYKYALSEYTSVYQKENSALMAFLVGVTLCQMACQKFSAKKHSLVAQAIAYFWKYRELRGHDGLQEVHYNLGRAFHQLGLLPPAVFHYKKAIEFSSPFLEQHDICNLKKEAAFNLHLIYMASGAIDLARMYLENYIEV